MHALVVSRLDRLSRSLRDFTALLERARRQGWALTVLDADVDTSTAAGEAMANVIGVFAQFERRRIGERATYLGELADLFQTVLAWS